jgi:hypothetical protein
MAQRACPCSADFRAWLDWLIHLLGKRVFSTNNAASHLERQELFSREFDHMFPEAYHADGPSSSS